MLRRNKYGTALAVGALLAVSGPGATDVTVGPNTIVSAHGLTVSFTGDWINLGVFEPGTSAVVANGRDWQRITNTDGGTFHDLVVDNDSGIVLGEELTLTGRLDLRSGSVDPGAYALRFESPPALPRFTSADSTGGMIDEPYGYRILFDNPINGPPVLEVLGALPSWLALTGDSLHGTQDTVSEDTVRMALRVYNVAYDTLELFISVAENQLSVKDAAPGYGPVFGIMAVPGEEATDFRVGLVRSGRYEIRLLDASGKEVWRYLGAAAQPGAIKVQGPIVPNGFYVVELRQADRLARRRFTQVR